MEYVSDMADMADAKKKTRKYPTATVHELRRHALKVATGSTSASDWDRLKECLECWRDPSEFGMADCDFIDDNLNEMLSTGVLGSIFNISKFKPEEHSKTCILLAQFLWSRLVLAIERAIVVAQLRRMANGEEDEDIIISTRKLECSTSFSAHACAFDSLRDECRSPPTPKCK